MNLLLKISTIQNPALPQLPVFKHDDTIEEFFNNFVMPLFPKEKTIKAWHALLMKYVEDIDNLSCCVRFGNNGCKSKSSYGEAGYYKLRRGWLTKDTASNFEYFFADNFFSAFIYKMALDGYVPTLNEFSSAFRTHQFPYGFGILIDKKINEYKCAIIPTANNPGFLNTYKLSHVFDSGEHFDIGGADQGDSYLSDKYYPLGHSNDFLRNKDHIRRMFVSDKAKRVIVAKFLRFAHPFNYFLTPTKKKHFCGVKVYKNDIGEEPLVIDYVRQYLKKTYPTEYNEFVSKIMWYENPNNAVVTGMERIDITYGLNVQNGNQKRQSTTNNAKSFKRSQNSVGQYAKKIFTILLDTNHLNGTMINNLLDSNYCKKELNVSRPVLVDSNAHNYDRKRYYKDAILGRYLITNDWYDRKNHRKLIDDWLARNSFTI